MTTTNPRINVTIPKDIALFLEKQAEKNNTSMSKIAAQMIELAMEMDEDIYYSKIADAVEKSNPKWIDNSENIWK